MSSSAVQENHRPDEFVIVDEKSSTYISNAMFDTTRTRNRAILIRTNHRAFALEFLRGPGEDDRVEDVPSTSTELLRSTITTSVGFVIDKK